MTSIDYLAPNVKRSKRLRLKFRRLPDGTLQEAIGREAQTLLQLLHVGETGLSGLESGATRLSAYIHDLRHVFALAIESASEGHGGRFSGHHSRYRLRSPVQIVWRNDIDIDPPNMAMVLANGDQPQIVGAL